MPVELVAAAILVVLLIAVVRRYWRAFLGLGAVGAAALAVLCLQDGVDCPFNPNPPPPAPPHEELANIEIVYAVYTHLSGKTYTDYLTTNRPAQVPCSQLDYDTDWAKGDPNAGTCRGTGGSGYGYKTVSRPERVPVTKQCPVPPEANSPAWHVQLTGPGQWIVSSVRGRWTVEKAGSGYRVTPHQPC